MTTNQSTKAQSVSDATVNGRRPVIFKVVRTDMVGQQGKQQHSVVALRHFSTKATDVELQSWLDDAINRLEELRETRAASAYDAATLTKRFAVYVRDLEQDVAARPLIMVGPSDLDAHSFRLILLEGVMDRFESYKSDVYQNMINYAEEKGWLFQDLAKAKNKHLWREVCRMVHPFYLSEDLTEEQRELFTRRSLQTILKGLRTGVYTSKNFSRRRKQRVSSRKRTDRKAHVRNTRTKSKRSH